MVAANSGLERRTTLGLLALVGALALACASSSGTVAPSAPAASSDRLTDVRVTSESGETIVMLSGLGDAIYTANVHENPRALVLDLASVEIATSNDLFMIYDGLVDNVTVSSFGGGASPLTRVEIGLAEQSEYEIVRTEEGLSAVIRTAAADATTDPLAASDAPMLSEQGGPDVSVAAVALDPWGDPEAQAIGETLRSPEVMPVRVTGPATTLKSVRVSTVEGGVLVHLQADGIVGALETFTLDNPARLVVDLPGLGSEVEESSVGVDAPHVARVRIGAHADKVRIVVDGGEIDNAFDERRVTPAADGLYIAIGSGDALETALYDAVAAAAASVAQATAAVEMTAVEMEPTAIELEMEPLALALDSEPTELDGEIAMSGEVEEALADEMVSDEPEELAWEMDSLQEDAASPSDAALALSEQDDEAALADSMESLPLVVALEEPEAEPMLASSIPATAQVFGIHYDSEDEYERVVILSDTPVDYDLLMPDDETIVVSLWNATVAPEATGRVATRPKKPISLISTFQQPDVETPEVRVVIKRASGLEPEVTRRGSMLFIDFPNTGLVAAPPPAFAEDEMMGADPGSQLAMSEPSQDESMVEGDMLVAAPIGDDSDNSALGEPMADEWAEGDVPAAMDWEAPIPGDDAMQGYPEDMAVSSLDMLPPMPGDPGALEPPASVDILAEGGLIDGKEYEGRRISLDFKDVPVADVLRLIAEVSDLNLIAGDEVEGNVTIRLVDVPWDQALDVILLTKGLGFVRVGNVLRIAPAEIIKAEEEVRLQERRNKETLEDLVVKLQPVNYAGVADMAELVKRLLSPRGTVNVDARTNTLILKDIPSVIDEATALIRAIDTETPQVMIEAKIVEAALDFSRELGSRWSIGTNSLEDGFGGNSPRRTLGGPDFRFHDENSVIFGNPITSVPTALASMSAFVLNEDFNVNVQIAAAESTGQGKVISSPRVLTLDNREAEIQQGVSIPFQTFENGDAKLEFIDAVLSLLVTPHVTSDRTIIMQLEVTRNAPDDSVPTPTGSPAIARAETRTEVLVKDGQTLVIGGIYTVTESERESHVPYLHRIPVIGSAFKSREVTDQRKELLIFVTPRIVMASELAGS